MVCLECGCDTWFEFKNNMKITTAEDCECNCHKDQVNKKLCVADEMYSLFKDCKTSCK